MQPASTASGPRCLRDYRQFRVAWKALRMQHPKRAEATLRAASAKAIRRMAGRKARPTAAVPGNENPNRGATQMCSSHKSQCCRASASAPWSAHQAPPAPGSARKGLRRQSPARPMHRPPGKHRSARARATPCPAYPQSARHRRGCRPAPPGLPPIRANARGAGRRRFPASLRNPAEMLGEETRDLGSTLRCHGGPRVHVQALRTASGG